MNRKQESSTRCRVVFQSFFTMIFLQQGSLLVFSSLPCFCTFYRLIPTCGSLFQIFSYPQFIFSFFGAQQTRKEVQQYQHTRLIEKTLQRVVQLAKLSVKPLFEVQYGVIRYMSFAVMCSCTMYVRACSICTQCCIREPPKALQSDLSCNSKMAQGMSPIVEQSFDMQNVHT